MKARKILSALLVCAMLLGIMSFTALAENVVVLPSGVTADSFGDNTVTDGTTYWATLQAAVEAIDAAKTAGATLYCKPDADVGSMTHAPVCSTLTVYGNDATVSGGERDFDIGNTDPNSGADVTGDMTLTVKNLNGCAAWGRKATEHTVNLVFESCDNMAKVYVDGTAGVLNTTITDSSFIDDNNPATESCTVYSNANGTITLTRVAFTGVDKAVNLNHKVAGTQTVVIDSCTFTNCGRNVNYDQIPVRVLSSVAGGVSELTVSGCSFSGTVEGGADILLDYGAGSTNYTISGTAANVLPENSEGNATMIAITASDSYTNVEPSGVAKIGEESFETLAAAIDAATEGQTITMISDVTLDSPVTVAKGKNIILDLAGKTITYNSTTQSEAMISNKGNLTINDSVGTGVINYNYTGAADPSYGKGNYTISNSGTLTVNGGYITIAKLSKHAKYPIDNNSTTGDAILVINGGHLYNYNTSAIRQFCNSTTYKNSVTINGGLIEGYSAIWVQNPTSKTVNGSLAITGGEVKTTAAAYVNGTAALKDVSSAIYCTSNSGSWDDSSYVSITGGTINENVNFSASAPAAITVDTTICNGKVEVPAPTGVAKIGDESFETLADAVAAAGAGDTITIVDNIDLDGKTLTIPAGSDIILDLNGKTISSVCNTDQTSMIIIENSAKLTVKDSSEPSTGKITYGVGTSNVGFELDVKGDLVLESGTIELTGSWSLGFAVDVRPNAWATAYTAPTTFVMNGGKISSSDTAVRVASNSSDTYEPLGVSFTMNGGVIESDWDAVFVQHLYANNLNIVINDGEVSAKNSPLRIYGENVVSDIDMDINGGSFDYTGEVTTGWVVENVLKGTETLASGADIQISGGTFEGDVSDYLANGYTISENTDGTFGVKTNWITATDAGAYGDGKVGMMRWLFGLKVDGTVSASGIKYIKNSNIGADVSSNVADEVSGNAKAFYGDITNVPETANDTYYAVAYITIDGKTYWSKPIANTPNFEKIFADYNGGAN